MSWALEISRSVEHTGWADEMGKCKEHAMEARCHGKGDEDDDDDDDVFCLPPMLSLSRHIPPNKTEIGLLWTAGRGNPKMTRH